MYDAGDDHSSHESQGHRSRSKVNATAASYMTGVRSSRFPLYRHQLRASEARRAAWRGRGQRRSPARVGIVTRSDLDPRSRAVFSRPKFTDFKEISLNSLGLNTVGGYLF